MTFATARALGACGGEDTTAPAGSEPTNPPTTREQLQHTSPAFEEIRAKLQEIVQERNGGLGFEMWATIVDRDGLVLDVLFSGEDRASEWHGLGPGRALLSHDLQPPEPW